MIKHTLIVFLFLCGITFGAWRIHYDPADGTVPNRVTIGPRGSQLADEAALTNILIHRSPHHPSTPAGKQLSNPESLPATEWKYWKVSGTTVVEMTAQEISDLDASSNNQLVLDRRSVVLSEPDLSEASGVRIRALIELFNKRDNYLVNRIAELQGALDAMKASSGPADNIRGAIPASWLPTNTRTKLQAIQDYKDDINAGNQD